MWLFIVIWGLLVMGENCNCWVWFFCDELFMLYKLFDFVEIVLEVCKFGGCYVFGIQFSIQMEDIYGEKVVVILLDVMNIRVFFCLFSYKIVDYVVYEIGEKEILKVSEQYFYGVDFVCDGVLIGKEMECVILVSYFDIQLLFDLICYVMLFGFYLVVKLVLKYQECFKVVLEFIFWEMNLEVEVCLSVVLVVREVEGCQMFSLFELDIEVVVLIVVEVQVEQL